MKSGAIEREFSISLEASSSSGRRLATCLKARALSRAGIEIAARLAFEAAPNPYSLAYLRTRRRGSGMN